MNRKFYGYIVAGACFIIMFVNIGAIGTIGVLMPAIAADTGQSVGDISIVVSTSTTMAFLGSFVAGKIIGKFGAKRTLTFGLLLNAIHYAFYALSGGKIIFFVIGSLFCGVNLAIATQGTVGAIINQWFISKRSTVIGIVFGAGAMGSAIFLFICGLLIKSVGWVTTNWALAGVLLFVAVPLSLLIRTPEQMDQKPLGWEQEAEKDGAADAQGEGELAGVDFKGALRTPSFWLLMLAMPMLGLMPAAFKTFAPSFWQHGGMDPLVSSQFITLFMIVATIATWISGTIADKFGNTAFIIYLHVLFVSGMGVVIYSAETLATSLVLVSLFLVGASYPLYSSVPATLCAGTFGKKSYAQIVTTLMGAFYFGLIVMSPLVKLVLRLTGSFVPLFTLMMGLGVASLFIIVVAIRLSPIRKQKALAE